MVSIVIPVYNEGKNIEKVLQRIVAMVHFPYEICIIYDSDDDTTIEPARLFMQHNSEVRLLKNAYGHGALNAIKTGLTMTTSEAVIVTMADLCDDPITMNEMYKMYKNGFDIVCASRYMAGGKQLGGPLIKGLMSKFAGLSLCWLTRIPTHDVTNSFKLYSRSVLSAIQIQSKGGFELGMELTVKAYVRGFRIAEVPTLWQARIEGESRFRLIKWLPNYLRWYFHCFRIYLPSR